MNSAIKSEWARLYWRDKEKLIMKALALNNINADDLKKVAKDCRIEVYPDKSETYFYKDKPMLSMEEPAISINYIAHDSNWNFDTSFQYMIHDIGD